MVAALTALVALSSTAHADEAETERRLKRIGVPKTLRELVAKNAVPNTEFLKLLALLARARDDVAPAKNDNAPAVDPVALIRGIDAVFVDVLLLGGRDPDADEEGRRPVNRAAAELLADASDDVLSQVRVRLARRFRAARSVDDLFETTPYRPALRLVATREDAAALGWMLDVALHDDMTGERAERCLALLLAVPHFPKLPGAVRRRAADTIANRFVAHASASRAVTASDPNVAQASRMRWSRFRPRVMEALLHLATDPASGAEPREDRERVILDVPEFAEWLRDRRSLRKSPWR